MRCLLGAETKIRVAAKIFDRIVDIVGESPCSHFDEPALSRRQFDHKTLEHLVVIDIGTTIRVPDLFVATAAPRRAGSEGHTNDHIVSVVVTARSARDLESARTLPINVIRVGRVHEHACLRCDFCEVEPSQARRLDAIRNNLRAQVDEAQKNRWLGDVDQLRITIEHADRKAARLAALTDAAPVQLAPHTS